MPEQQRPQNVIWIQNIMLFFIGILIEVIFSVI